MLTKDIIIQIYDLRGCIGCFVFKLLWLDCCIELLNLPPYSPDLAAIAATEFILSRWSSTTFVSFPAALTLYFFSAVASVKVASFKAANACRYRSLSTATQRNALHFKLQVNAVPQYRDGNLTTATQGVWTKTLSTYELFSIQSYDVIAFCIFFQLNVECSQNLYYFQKSFQKFRNVTFYARIILTSEY